MTRPTRRRTRRTAASLLLSVLVLLGLQVPAAGPASAADCTAVVSAYGRAPLARADRLGRAYDLTLTLRLGAERCSNVEYRAEVWSGDRLVAEMDSSGRATRTSTQATLGTVRTQVVPYGEGSLWIDLVPYQRVTGYEYARSFFSVEVPNDAFDTTTGSGGACAVGTPYSWSKPC